MHGGEANANRRPSLATVAASFGFRRVDLVRIVVADDRTTASATGIVHRYPRTVSISVAAAEALAAAGARLRVVRSRTDAIGHAC